MAISKGNNEEKILLDVSANVDDATSEIQKLEKELQKLQDVKINASGADLVKVNQQIKDVESAIAKANSNKLAPKTDNGNLKNTVLSLHEMEDLLNKIRDEQKVTKDPLKLQQLSKEAGELELKIRDINEPFRDINREIGELEDRLYAMAVAGERNTQEFQQTVLKVAELKKVVVDIDTAVDAISTDKFGKFIGVGEQMTGVFGGVTSALQIMGVDASRAEEQMAKLMQLQGIAQGLQSLNQFRKQWTGLMASMKAGKVATETINTISDATETATTATDGLSKANKGASVSSKILGTAMKAIPIMLVVSAIGFLIANFDKVKEVVLKFLPSLKFLEDGFNKVKNAVTDFVGITSDATRALDKLEQSTLARNKGIDRQIELLEASGGKEKEIYNLRKKQTEDEIYLLNQKAKVNEKLSAEEQEQLIVLHQKKNILFIEEKKRLQDEAKEVSDTAKEKAKEAQQAYQEQLKILKGYLKEAEKVTFASNHNQRQVELKQIKDKYSEQIELAKKLKQDYQKLESAQQIESNAINKKYDTQYFDFIKNNGQQFLDSFSAEYLSTIESYNNAKVNATDEHKKDLEVRLNNQLVYLSKVKQLQIAMKNAEDELANGGNEIDKDVDSFEVQKQKLDNQLQLQKEYADAQLYNLTESKQLENAENERLYVEGQERLKELMLDPSTNAFAISNLQVDLNARLSAIQANNTEIEDATKKHNDKLNKLDKDHAKAKEKINKEKKAYDEDLIKGTAEFLSTASDLFGEHTVANKAMNIASATMNAYVAGSKAFAELPYPANFVGMATAIAGGLVNVKKIMDVKIPDAKGGDTASQAINNTPVSYSAPTINSTVLRNEENGTNNITSAITESGNNNQVVKAYITNQDLQTNEEKNKFIKNISSY
ncbi:MULTISPECIES: hypothetical protein [Sphingobacterium]|uniref:hypothetical protein n=1 Tax=Sphingobacterium TaxID=28453 RepID=UPI0013DD6531|nr:MULTISPECIES: hypothetical protein [unclassified Sphingobacterium]